MGRAVRVQSWAEKGGKVQSKLVTQLGVCAVMGWGVGEEELLWGGGGRVRAVVRRWRVERRVRAWGWGRRWRGLGGLIVLSGLPCCEGQNLIWIDFTWCTARLSTIFHPVAR